MGSRPIVRRDQQPRTWLRAPAFAFVAVLCWCATLSEGKVERRPMDALAMPLVPSGYYGDNLLLTKKGRRSLQYRQQPYYSQGGQYYSQGGQYTTVEDKGFFERLGDSFFSVLFGIILCIVAPALLWWNEGRAVRRTKQIGYVETHAKPASRASAGGLVHVVGLARPRRPDAPLVDPVFGVPEQGGGSASGSGLLVLQRTVNMYQWVEHSESRTDTTYSYDKEWRSGPVDSNSFHEKFLGYTNPPMNFRNETFYCRDGVELVEAASSTSGGGFVYKVSDQLHRKIQPTEKYYNRSYDAVPTVPIDGIEGYNAIAADAVPVAVATPVYSDEPPPTTPGGGIGGFFSGLLSPQSSQAQAQAQAKSQPAYGSTAPTRAPARWIEDRSTMEFGPSPVDIGTYRVHWNYSGPRSVSILAGLGFDGASLKEWTSEEDASFAVSRLEHGEKTLPQMIASMRTENTVATWVLRILGVLLWWMALKMIASPLEVLFDLGTVPFLGLEPGTLVSYLTGTVAFLVSLALSLVVIAVAWLFYRPVYGILLLVSAAFVVYCLPPAAPQKVA